MEVFTGILGAIAVLTVLFLLVTAREKLAEKAEAAREARKRDHSDAD